MNTFIENIKGIQSRYTSGIYSVQDFVQKMTPGKDQFLTVRVTRNRGIKIKGPFKLIEFINSQPENSSKLTRFNAELNRNTNWFENVEELFSFRKDACFKIEDRGQAIDYATKVLKV